MEIISFLFSQTGLGVIGGIISLGSLVVSVYPYMRTSNKYTQLRKNVASISRIELSGRKYSKLMKSKRNDEIHYWETLEEWLANAEIIINEIKDKVISRSISIIFIYISALVVIIQDTDNYALPEILQALEIHDIAIFFITGLTNYFLLAKNHLYDEQEKDLVIEFNKIRSYHYDKKVKPKIQDLLFSVKYLMNDEVANIQDKLSNVAGQSGLKALEIII